MAESMAGVVAPAEPVVNAPGASNPVNAPAAPTGQEQAQEPVTPRTFTEDEHKQAVSKAVSERLAKERRRIEREARSAVEAQFYREQLERGQRPHQHEERPQSGEPQVKDYPDYEEYLLAKAEWRLEQKQKASRQQEQRQTAEQSEAQHYREMASRLREKFAAATEEAGEDVEEALRSSPHITEPMVRYIDESDAGAKVAAFLAANAKEQARIAKLPPTQQVRELDKIEAKLTAAPKPSNAPTPIVPGGTNATSGRKDWRDMSTEEHVKAYRESKRRST